LECDTKTFQPLGEQLTQTEIEHLIQGRKSSRAGGEITEWSDDKEKVRTLIKGDAAAEATALVPVGAK
jgi:hypothetical protein